ncbi:NAD(P)/FAD-dependent oxidoreductase [Rhizobium sp. L1K21]|uniref:flavin-containing monooxygenase n=1 Tax=Rhizobium sp. L1K21 TaxID=2954933 RepID=UPI0020932E9A|nr:NAD(P)/FAD-dependent oxidoreductase [Rhizobium sp. L1K21]MCO6186004.1 NAD(P)/FAD-dependent oxidoreductase [Rhizobium sp. L1K21]
MNGTSETPLDVLIIGAGLSGIGCACRLTLDLPDKSLLILEARDVSGGTWDLFRYPGIRSDSDLFTFGYDFEPWKSDTAIADGGAILAYLRDTAQRYGVEQKIRYNHAVIAADWESEEACWRVTVEHSVTGVRSVIYARWLFSAAGYYDYAEGYRPEFPGEDEFAGKIIHPQFWPEDLDYAGKRIAVIGSGATAVTLLPALAAKAAHVTQVQRTPTYVVSVPARDPLATILQRFLPNRWVYAISRRRQILRQRWFFVFCQRFPNAARRLIRGMVRRNLPADYPIDVHFNPPYDPWDQRLCAVPDGDLFKALSGGKASIVTGQIDRFTRTGIRMTSGEAVAADIIITATGLKVQVFGKYSLTVDGQPVQASERLVYKGMMLDGVPNFSFAIGYTNSSWTLKIGLLTTYLCRLLKYMGENGYASAVAKRPDGQLKTRPLLDFGAGYIQRAVDGLPRQGEGYPWVMSFSYFSDAALFKRGRIDDADMHFSPPPSNSKREAAA